MCRPPSHLAAVGAVGAGVRSGFHFPFQPTTALTSSCIKACITCRPVTGTTVGFSQHSYGWAIDINPTQIPTSRVTP